MSSFVKRTRGKVPSGGETPGNASQLSQAPGVRPSLHNGWPVMSSGLADWDEALFSDGFPLGSLVCIQEDEPTQFFKAFADYFVSEGIAQGHVLGIAVADEDPMATWENLPRMRPETTSPGDSSQPEAPVDPAKDKDIRIAWRYKSLNTVEQVWEGQKRRLSRFCHRYDLSEKHGMQPSDLPGTLMLLGIDLDREDSLSVVCDQLENHLKALRSSNRPARILIRSWHLSVWTEKTATKIRCLQRIRSLVRDYWAVALVSYQEAAADSRLNAALYHWSDVVLQLDSFQGQGASVAGLGDYLGVMRVRKLNALGSGLLRPPRLECNLFSFKRGRRKFIMDPAHSAPDEEVTSFETGKRLGGESGVPNF